MSLIYVGIPSIDGKPCVATVKSLLSEQLLAQREGVYLLVEFLCGCSLIGHARNMVASRFLGVPECQQMVFVDADIGWKAGDLVKLAKMPQPVIGATYRTKEPTERFHYHKPLEKVGSLYRVGGVPTGFLKIDRSVFEDLRNNTQAYEGPDGVLHNYFPTGFHDGVMYGEDFGFCRLWREHGGEVWLDPSINLRHYDGFQQFSGDAEEWLRNNNGA